MGSVTETDGATRSGNEFLSRVAFWLALAVVFIVPWRNGLYVYGNSVTIGLIFGAVFGLVWAAKVVRNGRVRTPNHFHVLFVLFACLSMLSTLWSINAGRTVGRSVRYVYFSGFMIALWDTFRTRDDLLYGLQAWACGGMVLFGSLLLSMFLDITSRYETYNRAAAIGYGPNSTAAFLALTVPIAWYLAQTEDAPGGPALLTINYLYTIAGTCGLVLTASRGGLIAFVPVLLFVATYGFEHRFFRRHRYAFVVVGLVTAVGFLLWVPPEMYERMSRFPQAIRKNLAGDGRVRFWLAGLEVFRQHPVLGVGSGNFKPAVAPIMGRPHSPHNTFVSITVDMGIVGLVTYSSVLTAVAQRVLQPDRSMTRLWITTLASWFVVANLFAYMHAIATYVLFTFVLVGASLPHLQGFAAGDTPDEQTDASRDTSDESADGSQASGG